jgi:hypothetical protein
MKNMKKPELSKRMLGFIKAQIKDHGKGMALAVHGFFRKGGAFDKAASDDKRMQWEEFQTLSNTMTDKMAEKYGEWPKYDDKELRMAYDVYNGFSEEEGISKCDLFKIMHTEEIMKRKFVRAMKKKFHYRVTKSNMKAFAPLYKMVGMKMKEAKEADGEEWAGIKKFVKVTKKSMGLNLLLMGHMFMKEDGVFDKMAGEDGRMSFKEFIKTDAVIRAKLTKKFGK